MDNKQKSLKIKQLETKIYLLSVLATPCATCSCIPKPMLTLPLPYSNN